MTVTVPPLPPRPCLHPETERTLTRVHGASIEICRVCHGSEREPRVCNRRCNTVTSLHRVRLHGSSPARYDTSRVVIGLSGLPALNTAEHGLAGPVGRVDAAAGKACPAGVAWVHLDYANTRHLGLVSEELAQLSEGPIPQCRSLLRTPSRDPLEDAGQLLDRDASAGALGAGDNGLADNVVLVPLEQALLAGALPQESFGAPGALGLQLGAQSDVPMAQAVAECPGVQHAIAGSRDGLDPHIDAEIASRLRLRRIVVVARDQQPPAVLAILNQQSFTDLAGGIQSGTLVAADVEGNVNSAFQRADFHEGGAEFVKARARAFTVRGKGDGRPAGEPMLLGPVLLVGVGDPMQRAQRVFCQEAATGTTFVISDLLEREMVECLSTPGYPGEIIAGLLPSRSQPQQLRALYLRWRESKGDDSYAHELILPHLPEGTTQHLARVCGEELAWWTKPTDTAKGKGR